MWRVERGRVAFTQAFKASACSAFIRPELPPTSNAVRPSIPLCPNTPCQPRIVSSSHRKNSATSCQLLPASRSTRALARRVTRQTIEPSRASAIRAFRSSSLRKPPRITRRSESRQPQHASDFSRILSESGYTSKARARFILREFMASGSAALSVKVFWAREYFVSTVGRDETVIRDYIKKQETEDQKLEQLNLWR